MASVCNLEKKLVFEQSACDVPDDGDRILGLALDIVQHMLECGAEVRRVEDTAQRICRAYGAEQVEVFSITTLIVATIVMPGGRHRTQTRRVYYNGNNLWRLENLNAVSRRICATLPPLDEAIALADAAAKTKPYSTGLLFLASVLVAGGFSIFFGGSLRDGIGAAIAGLLIQLLDRYRLPQVNHVAHVVFCSLLGGVVSCLTVLVGLAEHIDMVMIGAIMLQIPGLAMGNALRDVLGGDIMAGILRLTQSLVLAVAIAVGFGLALFIFGRWLI